MKKRVMQVAIIVVALIIGVTILTPKSSPEKTAGKFFESVKSGDFETAMKCFSPAVQAQYKASAEISNSMLGLFGLNVNTSALLSGLFGYSAGLEYQNYDFKVKGAEKVDSTHSDVMIDVYVDKQLKQTTTLSMVKIDGKWYIER